MTKFIGYNIEKPNSIKTVFDVTLNDGQQVSNPIISYLKKQTLVVVFETHELNETNIKAQLYQLDGKLLNSLIVNTNQTSQQAWPKIKSFTKHKILVITWQTLFKAGDLVITSHTKYRIFDFGLRPLVKIGGGTEQILENRHSKD